MLALLRPVTNMDLSTSTSLSPEDEVQWLTLIRLDSGTLARDQQVWNHVATLLEVLSTCPGESDTTA